MLDRRTFIKDAALFTGALLTGSSAIASATPTVLSEEPKEVQSSDSIEDLAAHILRMYTTKLPSSLPSDAGSISVDDLDLWVYNPWGTRFGQASKILAMYCCALALKMHDATYENSDIRQIDILTARCMRPSAKLFLNWSSDNVFPLDLWGARVAYWIEPDKAVDLHPVEHIDDVYFRIAEKACTFTRDFPRQTCVELNDDKNAVINTGIILNVALLTALQSLRARTWEIDTSYPFIPPITHGMLAALQQVKGLELNTQITLDNNKRMWCSCNPTIAVLTTD